MNDFKENAKFSFGKIELGVVPQDAEIKPTLRSPHDSRVHIALCNKMDAVDALDALRHSLVSNLSKVQYTIIRNSLEEMADLIRAYEGKPVPPARNVNRRQTHKRKGGKR